MTRMKRGLLAGALVLGMGGAACEEQGTGTPAPPPGTETGARLGEEIDTSAPTGATVEPGERPQMGEVQRLESERRELYEDVAEDVGVEPVPDERRVQVPGSQPATGGSGAADEDEQRK